MMLSAGETYTSSDRMRSFVIVPRHGGYWVYEDRGEGKRRALECFSCEDEAITRLRQLQAMEDACQQRRVAQEASRFFHSSERAWA
jgi:hypothetical protein